MEELGIESTTFKLVNDPLYLLSHSCSDKEQPLSCCCRVNILDQFKFLFLVLVVCFFSMLLTEGRFPSATGEDTDVLISFLNERMQPQILTLRDNNFP